MSLGAGGDWPALGLGEPRKEVQQDDHGQDRDQPNHREDQVQVVGVELRELLRRAVPVSRILNGLHPCNWPCYETLILSPTTFKLSVSVGYSQTLVAPVQAVLIQST